MASSTFRMSAMAMTSALVPLLLSCATPRTSQNVTGDACALIETDDDITSGSATAGALYIGEDEVGRRLLTSDVLAVAQGFHDAGYRCVIVADSHDTAVDRERLIAAGLRVVRPGDGTGWRWPFFGVSGPEIKASALVGFHTRAGAPGFRPHTVNDFIKRITIRGVESGEVGTAFLGHAAAGFPVVLVVGDEGATAEAKAFAPKAKAVAVRWHDEKGEVRFLSEAEAPEILRRAAREAAKDPATAAVSWKFPLPLSVEPRVARYATDGARSAAEVIKQGQAEFAKEAGALAFTPTIDGGAIRWEADNAAAAYLSLVAVASSLKPPHHDEAWPFVSQGFAAWGAKRWDEALAAYRKALEIEPTDSATHCRIGRVHLDRGAVADALAEYAEGLKAFDELDDGMRAVCQLGVGKALERAGRTAEAVDAYRRVLQLADVRESHAGARDGLQRCGARTGR